MLKKIIFSCYDIDLDFSVYCVFETESLDDCESTKSILNSRFLPSVTGTCNNILLSVNGLVLFLCCKEIFIADMIDVFDVFFSMQTQAL